MARHESVDRVSYHSRHQKKSAGQPPESTDRRNRPKRGIRLIVDALCVPQDDRPLTDVVRKRADCTRRRVALQWREPEHTPAIVPEQPPHASIAEPAFSVEEEDTGRIDSVPGSDWNTLSLHSRIIPANQLHK